MILKQHFKKGELIREKLIDENAEKVFNETIDWVNKENKRLKKIGVEAKKLWTYKISYNEENEKKCLRINRRQYKDSNDWDNDYDHRFIITYYSNTKSQYIYSINGQIIKDKIIQKPATEVVADTIKWLKEQNEKIRKENPNWKLMYDFWDGTINYYEMDYIPKGKKPTHLSANIYGEKIIVKPL